MDQSERVHLRALCEAATPGPWDAIYDEDAGEWMVRTGHADVAVLTWQQALDALGLSPVTMRTAAFIAASRAALPALLDDADAADARIAKAERERDEAVAMLRNLLARVHRDGGQHSDAVGLAQATEEADEIIARAFAELARLRAPRPSAIVLRPVDPMTARGLSCACDEWGPGHLDGCPNGDAEPVNAPVPFDDEDLALADGDRRALDVVTRKRDEARDRVAALETVLREIAGSLRSHERMDPRWCLHCGVEWGTQHVATCPAGRALRVLDGGAT